MNKYRNEWIAKRSKKKIYVKKQDTCMHIPYIIFTAGNGQSKFGNYNNQRGTKVIMLIAGLFNIPWNSM